MKDLPAFNRILKSEYPTVAKRIISDIENQALSIGWTISQLDDLARTLTTFLPAKIGDITLQSISILILHHDGKQRGAVSFYNMAVKQPWIK